MVRRIMIDDNDHDQGDHGWWYGNDDLLIAGEAPKLSINVVISKQAVVFIGTVLAIVPANYLKKIKTSIVKIDID